MSLVAQRGARRWESLASFFTDRTGAQVRARWAHRLSEQASSRAFSASEDEFILQTHAREGSCWARIAARMERRLAHDVQNRFKLLQRRLRRKAVIGASESADSPQSAVAGANKAGAGGEQSTSCAR